MTAILASEAPAMQASLKLEKPRQLASSALSASPAVLAGSELIIFHKIDSIRTGQLAQPRKSICLKIVQNEAVQTSGSRCEKSVQLVKGGVSASIAMTSEGGALLLLTRSYDSNKLLLGVEELSRTVQEVSRKEPQMESTHATAIAAETFAPPPSSIEERRSVIQRAAAETFVRHPDWATFFREIMGLEGIVRKMFRSPEELAEFEKTAEYAEIQQMLAKLREKSSGTDDKEPTRVITVRLPKSLHESLKTEAFERHTSMNQLCISKLLQVIGEGLVPTE